MLFSFRNRRVLIQATSPLARKLANLLTDIKICEKNNLFPKDINNLLKETLSEIEVNTSLAGGSSFAENAKKLLNDLNENSLKILEVEKFLVELDMQPYHASLLYERFNNKEKEWLTWYKLTPNIKIETKFSEFLKNLNSNINSKLNIDYVDNINNIIIIFKNELKNNKNKSLYEKLFISFIVDRLVLLKKNKEKYVELSILDFNKKFKVEAIKDAFYYVASQKEFYGIDSRAWSSLLWHANKFETKFTKELGLSDPEDCLVFFEKKEIYKEISEKIIPYIGNSNWPSWRALEGDFVSLSELFESKEINWDKVNKHLDHILNQSLRDDKMWNPGVFFKKIVSHLEKNPLEYNKVSNLLIEKLALWKDALSRRDPLSILNWIELGLKSKESWSLWFETKFIINNKIEQEIIYEIQLDIVNNKNLALQNIEALELNWLKDSIDLLNKYSGDLLELQLGRLNESLFWGCENKKISKFFNSININLDEENSGINYLNNFIFNLIKEEVLVEPNVVEDILVEPNVVEDVLVETNVVEDILVETNVVEDVLVETNVVEDVLVEPNVVEDILVEPNVVEDVLVEPNVVEDILVETNVVEDVLVETNVVEDVLVETNVVEDVLVETNVVEDVLVETNVVEENISEELYSAILSDAEDMLMLLKSEILLINETKECNNSFVRVLHSLKALGLNLNHNYVSNLFLKLELWGLRLVECDKKLSNKDVQIIFSIYSCITIIIENWKKKIKINQLPIDDDLNYIESIVEVKDNNRVTLSNNDLFPQENLVANEIDNIDYDIYDNFKEEALDIFDKLDNLNNNNVLLKNLNEVNRLLHTLKGGSKISGLMKLGAWVHQIEDLTTKNYVNLSEEKFISGLQYALDKARNIFSNSVLDSNNEFKNTLESKDITLKIPLNELEIISDALLASEASHKKVQLAFYNVKSVLDNAKEPIKRLNSLIAEMYLEAESLLNAGSNRKKKKNQIFDDLELDKFTYFHELTRKIEEAVADNFLYSNIFEKSITDLIDYSKTSKLWLNIAQKDLIKNLNNEAKSYENRLEATVRSACAELNKMVEVEFTGYSTIIDKRIIDEIVPALEHLVRNSVAHSIENKEERIASGKNEMARILVSSEIGIDDFRFCVSDDGAGINFDKIKKIAKSKNIADTEKMTNEELCKVMFSSGFSTSTTVNAIAGRGVGLDAVEKIITQLGGYIKVDLYDNNKPKFVISIPMPYWLLSGVKATVNNKTYVISSNQIEDVGILESKKVEEVLKNKKIEYNNKIRPCIYLDYVNDIQDIKSLMHYYPIIHLKNNKSIIVDSIEFLDKQPIKSVPNSLYKNKGIFGITVLSDSNVGIVLDAVSDFWNYLYDKEIIIHNVGHLKNTNLVLVVDDSLTVRKTSEKFLIKNGYMCATANNGLEAIKYLEKENLPSIILMDIEMPVMDGLEALQIIKTMPYIKDIPVVIISSRAVDKHINYAKSIGSIDFLGKPFDEEKLLNILNMYVKK